MPEYVYALHDFHPEHPDEISFTTGEKIEVVEKDDLYQDGWWQGRNLEGKVGLFPRSYTVTTPPVPSTIAFPQAIAPTASAQTSSDPDVPDVDGQVPTITVQPQPDEADDRERTLSQTSNGEMMRATLTDVQKAIEQLGRNDHDGTRSISFRSYTERSETEDELEADDEEGGLTGSEWHRDARERLAANARQQNEERERKEREARESTGSPSVSIPSTPMRSTAPPIDVELSDDSDDEEDDRRRHSSHRRSDPSRRPPNIPILEEDEDGSEAEPGSTLHFPQPPISAVASAALSTVPATTHVPLSAASVDSANIVPSEDFIVPLPDESDQPTATADRFSFFSPTGLPQSPPLPSAIVASFSSFSAPEPVTPPPAASPVSVPPSPAKPPAPVSPSVSERKATPPPLKRRSQSPTAIPLPASPTPVNIVSSPAKTTTPIPKAVPSALKVGNELSFASGTPSFPSPSLSTAGSTGGSITATNTGSIGNSIQQTLTPATTVPSSIKTGGGLVSPVSDKRVSEGSSAVMRSEGGSEEGGSPKGDKTHPSEWTVEQVVDWLRSKGFDQLVCEKFIEQEITGDVLLELDANVLKSEIGIVQYGKRVRIANAIADLRRPPSVGETPPSLPLPPNQMSNQTVSAYSSPSHAQSQHTHSHSHSTHHSFPSSSQSQPFPSQPQQYNASPTYTYTNSLMMPSPSVPAYMSLGSMGSVGSGGGMVSVEASPLTMDFPPGTPMTPGTSSMLRNAWRASDPGSARLSTPAEGSVMGMTTTVGGSFEDSNSTSVGTELVQSKESSVVGLGLGLPLTGSPPPVGQTNGKPAKNRPAQLNLSPSDGALNASVVAVTRLSNVTSEDRAVLSDSETGQAKEGKTKRRRLFGLSTDSSSLKAKASSLRGKDTSGRNSQDHAPADTDSGVASSNTVTENGKEFVAESSLSAPVSRRHSKKNSADDHRKASDRLSLFGSSFSSGLGKTRKPVPRLSSSSAEKADLEKPGYSSLSVSGTFSRIRNHGSEKKSGRPSTSDGTQSPRSKDDRRSKGSTPSVKETKDVSLLRKRTVSNAEVPVARPLAAAIQAAGGPVLKPGKSILEQIGTSDHNGWMRKKNDRYNTWKLRYFVLKGPHLYCLKSNNKSETKIKGYINIQGYKVQADENVDPGRYGFRITHESDKTHSFSSDEQMIIREWMKALTKATITRDYTNPVVSSSNIPTIPLTVAQAMNPAPRPPSPTAREATQRAHRRENPNQLSSRDAQVLLMGLPGKDKGSATTTPRAEAPRLEGFFSTDSASTNGQDEKLVTPVSTKSTAPPRPSRETRRFSSHLSSQPEYQPPVDADLIEWVNSHLDEPLQIKDPIGPLCSGLALLRIAEDIKGKPCSPPVPDSAFPSSPSDEKLDGLFKLFDLLLDNDVKMGHISINDIRQEKRDKVLQMLKALRAWEEKRRAMAQSIGKSSVTSGPFMAMSVPREYF